MWYLMISLCKHVIAYLTIQAAAKDEDEALRKALKAAGLSRKDVVKRIKATGINTAEEFKKLCEETLLDFKFKEA